MSRTAWISCLGLGALAVLATAARAQDDGYLMLDDVSIQGQVREPAVAIISSRLQPDIQGFKLEKSFFDQVRSPDEELVDLDPDMSLEERIKNRDSLLKRARILPQAAWPLTGGTPGADQNKAASEGQSGQ